MLESAYDVKQNPAKKRYAFTMGVYDCFHFGHLRLIERASRLGDILIVGVVDDEAVKAQKGPQRPIIPLEQRIEIVRALKFVDDVVVMPSFDPFSKFDTFWKSGLHYKGSFIKKFDVFVKGADQSHIPTDKIESEYGTIVTTLSRTPGISTSELIKKL